MREWRPRRQIDLEFKDIDGHNTIKVYKRYIGVAVESVLECGNCVIINCSDPSIHLSSIHLINLNIQIVVLIQYMTLNFSSSIRPFNRMIIKTSLIGRKLPWKWQQVRLTH